MHAIMVLIGFSTLGAAYFLYGKKESDITFMLSGGTLCFYPYFVSSMTITVVLGLFLAGIPFLVRQLDL